MEHEEDEETLDTFKGTIMEMLKDSVYMGKTIGKKSNELLNRVNNDDCNANKLEAVGLELINMFNSVKGNMWAIADILQNKLKKLNENHVEEVFKDFSTKVIEYKMHKISLGLDNKYILSVPSHKDAQTNFPSVSVDELKIEKQEVGNKCDNTEKEPSTSYENHCTTLKNRKGRHGVNLGLRKNNDTQDTNDSWEDSITSRSPTLMELWNRRPERKEINASDEDIDELKAEEEEELRNRKTPELNHTADDSSDDSFMDGRTPKREIKQSDSESLAENKKAIEPESESLAENKEEIKPGRESPAENKEEMVPEYESPAEDKEEIEPELPLKLDESFVEEETKLFDSNVDTAQYTKKTATLEDKDDENNSVCSDDIICDSNTDTSDSEKDKTVENTKSREKPTDVGSLDTDSGIETISKSHIPVETVDKLETNIDEAVILNAHETEEPESLQNEQYDNENSELSSEEMEILERGPYSMETVKLDSDIEELSDTDINNATQPILDESMNVSLQSDQEGNKMLDPNHINESVSSVLTKDVSLNIKNTKEIISSLNLVTEESSMTEAESKIIPCDPEAKEKIEDILEPALDESLKSSTSNKDVDSSPLLPSENHETKVKQLLNKDENLSVNAAALKNETESAKQPIDSLNFPPSNNSLNEDQNFDVVDKTIDAEQTVEPSNPLVSDILVPDSLASKDVTSRTKLPELSEDKDCSAEQSLECPVAQALVLETQISDAKQPSQSSNPQLSEPKASNSSEDLNLPSDCLASNGKTSNATQPLTSPNMPSIEEQSQEPNAKQHLISLNSQLADKQVSNESLHVTSDIETREVKQSTSTNDAEEPSLDERNLPPESLALNLLASDSGQSPESLRVNSHENNPSSNQYNLLKNSLALKDKASLESNKPLESLSLSPDSLISEIKTTEAKQSAESSNINLSPNPLASIGKDSCSDQPLESSNPQSLAGDDLNSDKDINLHPDSLASENEICVLQPSPNPQSTDVTQNKLSSENDTICSDSEIIVVSESDTEQETETYNYRSLENVKADVRNKNLAAECNSQTDSDATVIYENENVFNKQMVNSGDNEESISLTDKYDRDGEENLSQGSNKSFEFDISERLKEIGKNESEIDTSKTNKETGGVKGTVEVSDSDDEVHLDVTMEEILSDGSTTEQVVMKSEVIKIEDVEEIKPLLNPEDISSNENLPEKENTNEVILEKENTDEDSPDEVGDELLKLLREVEVPLIAKTMNSNKSKQAFNKKEAKNADKIFRKLLEESSLEMTDSDLSEEELKWDSIEAETSESDDGENEVEKLEVEDDSNQELLNKCIMKECYVHIERLDLNEQQIVVVNKRLTDSIDRLCDISNIINKRKYSPGDQEDRSKLKKFKKARKSTKKGTSDTESLSDISNSDTDNELRNDQTHSPFLAAPIEQKLDDLLANEICKGLKSDSDLESDGESDDSTESSEKNKKGNKNGETSNNAKVSKSILTKEEKEKKSWKNDPLLRGKLNSDSDTSTGSEKSVKKRILKRKYEHDTDFNLASESDSDCSQVYQQNKAWLEGQLISPIKKNIPLSDSSDSDSDCEFVPQRQSPQKSADDNETGPSSQKGRRNIRALMSNENLAEATQRANREEQERIERLEDRHKVKESLSQSFSQLDDEDLLVLDVDEKLGTPLITVNRKMTKKLKPHQRIGIQFMWESCYESVKMLKEHDGSGCILAHCMGLGKTFQVIALIHTLFSHDVTNTKHVLIVCPLSTVNNWKNEVKIAFDGIPDETLRILTIADKRELSKKYEIVKKWQLRKKCVLVLGYEGFETITNEVKLEKAGSYLKQRMLEALVDPGPDLVICDEGHLLRNKKALKTLALNKITTKRRIVLTGTPLQNNLLEYYYMVQFVKPNLLGTMKEFRTNFVHPITNGQYEDSTERDIKLMMKRTHVLHKLLKKTIQRIEDSELKMYLPKMVDHAVFIQLHEVQVELYNKFSEMVKNTSDATNKKGFLSDYYVFQYIGTHPHLLTVMDKMKNKKIKERDLITNEDENVNPICNIDGWWKANIPEDASEKIEYGNKLVVVKSIIEECEEIGDKVLVFSQCLGELDLIEHFLKKVGTAKCPSWQKRLDYFRMDGTVLPEDRSTICDKFNEKENKRMRLLLMSTKVGGLGLNLTAANRVIIMTVNWNPSFDTQSVFRVYRFGQEKKVFIYRLISLDTMEEKVYQRTVTKLAVAHRVIDKHQITRHYKSVDLQELYSSRPNADEERPTPNVPEDKVLAKLLLKLPFIFKYHEHQALLANRPEDNLNEQELNAAWEEFKKIKDAPAALPPPLPALPQLPLPNGPTYAHAFGLTKVPKNTVATGKEVNGDLESLVQYYIPKSNPPNLQQKNGRPIVNQMKNNLKQIANINSNTSKPKLPADTVITLIDDISEMIPLPPVSNANKQSGAEQDPLYISDKSSVGKPNGFYSRVLTYYSKKNLPSPKLPSSTSLFIAGDLPKRSNQKENGELIRSSRIPNASIIIDDNDQEGNKTKKPKTVLTENKFAVNKRKRNSVGNGNVLKKIRKLNNSNSTISLDDDAEIPDTNSESGSLSNEIIQNLGRSGITVHKVIKDSNFGDVITLD